MLNPVIWKRILDQPARRSPLAFVTGMRNVFKKARGFSLATHLNAVKIARAKILLTNSPLPLKQIATMCGFQDEYYFSAVFRRLTNLPPGMYRQRALRERE